MDSFRFDEVTKALASATSRRQALKTLLTTAIGGIFGLSGIATSEAAGNSACAKFCASVFGKDTQAAGQCTSQAAKGKGLCYSCGPASAGGTKPICCAKDASGACVSYSDATCCSGEQICQNNQCVTPTTTTTMAPTTTTTTSAPIFTTPPAPIVTTTPAPPL